MYEDYLNDYYKYWENKGEMTDDFANEIFEDLDQIMENGVSNIEKFTNEEDLDNAILAMMKVNTLINAAAAKKPKIIHKLSKWVLKLKSALQKLGKKISANQISMSVSYPAGFSVGLAWDI